MQYTTLGRTGLRVSVAGLGCGGNSRLGLGSGRSEDHAVALVRAALDSGITQSLRYLAVDHIDVYHLHAVQPKHYDYALGELVPTLLRERDRGKIRHLGITETPPRDPEQAMLSRALDDRCWEVVMLVFHMMNQGARRTVFPRSQLHGVGTLLMFVVRNIFSRPGVLTETLKDLSSKGMVPAELAASDHPLDFMIHEGGASSLTDAAYRFGRHEAGVGLVSPDHVRARAGYR